MKIPPIVMLLAICAILLPCFAISQSSPYVGSKACSECHPQEYDTFTTHSKKATSWKSIEVMASDLKPRELQQCFDCHTTGYGRGGFVSHEQTPHLADVGCETCHMAGGAHAESGGDPDLITRQPELAICERCHNAERVGSFNFKPLVYGGAH